MKKRRNDVIDDAVHTSQGIVGKVYQVVYEVPYDLANKFIDTSLDFKDAVKKKIGLNPGTQPAYVYRYHNGGWNYFMTLHPQREAEWNKYVRLAAQQPNRYRIVRSKLNPENLQCTCQPGAAQNTRRNGRRNPQSGADAMFESFHGEQSQETVVVEKEFHEHEWVAALGDLAECVIETSTGFCLTLSFKNDPPLLCSNEDGTQLYIEGGDQSVDLAAIGMDGEDWVKERMVLGEFAPPEKGRTYNLSYITQKKFDKFEEIEYQHDLSEPNEGESKRDRRAPAILEYDPTNEQLYIAGGQYIIKRPLIGMSPGIEN